jgi:endonuclease YncB( thermonuclease family)
MRAIVVLVLLLLAPAVCAAERLDGPVPARLLGVVDGDSVEVEARIWLGQSVRTLVRLRGIDTPELHGRCQAEREKAEAAKRFLAQQAAAELELTDIGRDKYGGRVIARVSAQGRDLGDQMIGSGLAVRYNGARKTNPWCARDR